eukprot:346807-Pyramimonas_sp.AAC.1
MATPDPERSNPELVSWAVSAINSMDKVGNHSPVEREMGVARMPASNNPFAMVDGGAGETQEPDACSPVGTAWGASTRNDGRRQAKHVRNR